MERLTSIDEKGHVSSYLFSENVLEIEDLWEKGNHSEVGYRARGRVIDRLAAYEDTGLTPEEIKALQEDNARLHKLLDDLEACITSKTTEPDSNCDDKVRCKDCDYLNMDSGKPFCCHSRMSTNGLYDWCNFGRKKQVSR